MKLHTKLSKVNKIDFFKNSYILWQDGIIEIDKELIFEGKIQNILRKDNIILVDFEEGLNNWIYDLETKIRKTINYTGSLLTNNILLVGKWNENYTERIVSAIKLDNFSILWSTNKAVYKPFIFNEYFISISNNIIFKKIINTAQPLWQFDIGSFGTYKPIYGIENERMPYQVEKFLGVWQEELLIACEGGLIITLSLQNGQLIRKWDVLPEHIDNKLKDTFHGLIHQSGDVFQLNKAGDTIFGLYYQHWVEISLKTGLISAKYLKETFDKHFISSFQTKSGYAEDETHLYSTVFLDQQKLELNYMPTAVCALNKITCEIDWLHRFDLDNTGDYVSVQVPQLADNKLYQLTQNHILHIFQKKNPSI